MKFSPGWKMFNPKWKIPHTIFFFFFSTHLTELEFSARAENFHIISPLDVWLVSKYPSEERLSILKKRIKSIENKAMLKSISQCAVTGLQSSTKGIGKIYEYKKHILGLLFFWNLHYIKQETMLKRLQEPFEREVGESKYGSPVVNF